MIKNSYILFLIFIINISSFHCINRESNIKHDLYQPFHYSVQWDFENFSAVKFDCDNNLDNFKVKFKKTINYNNLYKYDFHLFIENEEVPLNKKDSINNIYLFDLKNSIREILKAKKQNKKITVRAEITQLVYQGNQLINTYTKKDIHYINLVHIGDKYSVRKFFSSGMPQDYSPCQLAIKSGFYKKFYNCSNIDKTYKIFYKKILPLEKLNKPIDLFKLDLETYYDFNPNTSNVKNGSFLSVKLIGTENPKDSCHFIAPFILYNIDIVRSYIANCNMAKKDSLIEEKEIYIPININFISCILTTNNQSN